MKFLHIPVWKIRETDELDTNSTAIKMRLFDESVVGEFTIFEICSFFGIDGIECLVRQFKEWHNNGCLVWESKNLIHAEKKPFREYFESTRISECYAPQPLPEPVNGRIEWGMKKM
ncbi:hypothetical protein H7347_10485 [Corynebacterium sp. zg-331]|uniref:hypothetical protein n=1 Tax=unclassified Corynebacterium TaxID=2624378 RepID=UPI00128B5416|nr:MULTISPECIES: hypothetical protein [unclassified Corynebacterium]MBC3186980.1 hypothetical protein [Corynebacterium sp. zg-331]MPV53456.1 hypothetical protein [Corynebacterium sp. zg331]